jgi:hypothetical protein
MKSKIFLSLIIKIKNIHEFNVLSLSLLIFSTKKKNPSLAYFNGFSPNYMCCMQLKNDNNLQLFLVACDMCSCIRQVAKDNFFTSDFLNSNKISLQL